MHVHPTLSAAQYLCHAPVHAKTFSPSLLRKNISNRMPKRCLPPHASSTPTSSDAAGVEVNKPKRSVGARLRSAVRNRSIKEFMETINEEWRDYSSSIPIHYLPMEVLQMLYCFMVRNDGMLLIKPAEDYGVDLGITWTANLTKDQLPLAFGCSINTTQAYRGTVLLKNAKYIVDSLIRMQLTQKLEKILPPMIDKLALSCSLEEKERMALIFPLLSVLVMVVSLISLKNTVV
ncbi:unnamed protein product [Musa acuminata subsp. burmannicoides]